MSICDNNDEVTALKILQVLGTVHRAGYIHIDTLVDLLAICANRFAEQNNLAFYREFYQCMPNISDCYPFSPKAQACYFMVSQVPIICKKIEEYCPQIIDTAALCSAVSRNNITKYQDVEPLYRQFDFNTSQTLFQRTCDSYTVPLKMQTGYQVACPVGGSDFSGGGVY